MTSPSGAVPAARYPAGALVQVELSPVVRQIGAAGVAQAARLSEVKTRAAAIFMWCFRRQAGVEAICDGRVKQSRLTIGYVIS